MSDSDNQIPKAPTVKTSAVPLKKETVRITLRPSAPPSEPLPPVSPPPPTAAAPIAPAPAALPFAPPPPAPRGIASGAPTVPLRSAPPPVRPAGPPTVAVGAPPPPPSTRSIGAPPGPPASVGNKTIPLAQAPARPVPASAPGGATRPTGRLTGAPATQALPKATMKLTKTEPIQGGPPTATISSAPIKSGSFDDEDENDNEGFLNGVSIAALVGSIAALFIALLSFQSVPPFNGPMVPTKDIATKWQNNPESSWKIPSEVNPFSKKVGDSWTSTYAAKKADEHAIPARE